MDVSSVELRTSMLEWDEGDVHAWFATLGLPQYENQIRRAFVCSHFLVVDSHSYVMAT